MNIFSKRKEIKFVCICRLHCIDNLVFNGEKESCLCFFFLWTHHFLLLGSVWLFSHNWPLSATFLDEVVLSVCHTVVPIPTAKWTFSSKAPKKAATTTRLVHTTFTCKCCQKYLVPFHLTFPFFSETLAFSRHEMHLPLNEVWKEEEETKNRIQRYILQICHLTLGRKVALVLH